jgi:hypothetical protein
MGKLDMSIYLKHLRIRYHQGNRKTKSRILDELCESSGYHRKHAIRLLQSNSMGTGEKRPTGRPKVYEPEELGPALRKIWLATDQMCGKRLKVALPLWLPFYERHYGKLDVGVRVKLLSMSAASIDRLLKPYRSHYGRRLCGTKPGTLLKEHIAVKTEQWDEASPGYLEADTVAHCGTSLLGDFVWSITLTDIYSGWTELRATWNKGATGVLEQIKSVESVLPFPIKGFDSDNGGEFLNYHLLRYFKGRKEPVEFTRSRPYHKDDNAHVEQKNWTHVRQLLGYARFDNPKLVKLLNNLYQNEWSLLKNYFCPTIKLKEKIRVKSKIKKQFYPPLTPYQRLMESPHLSQENKNKLNHTFKQLDPFLLCENIQKKLKVIASLVDLSSANAMRQKKVG